MPDTSKNEINLKKKDKNTFLDAATLELLRDKIKFQIILMLLINNELSMTELSKITKRAKATIHRHLKKLIENDIIEVSKEKKVRGSIKAKYYKLVDKFHSYFALKETLWNLDLEKLEEDESEFKQKVILLNIYLKLVKESLEELDIFIKEYGVNFTRNFRLFAQELKDRINSLNIIFLTQEQYEKLMTKLNEFHSTLVEIKSENQDYDDPTRKPYFFASTLLKLDRIFGLQK